MREQTRNKIQQAIEKLQSESKSTSYRVVAQEAQCSQKAVAGYFKTEAVSETEAVTSKTEAPAFRDRTMETVINQAKERIKASGQFPTTPRLIKETRYTADEIDTYFKERIRERRAQG